MKKWNQMVWLKHAHVTSKNLVSEKGEIKSNNIKKQCRE